MPTSWHVPRGTLRRFVSRLRPVLNDPADDRRDYFPRELPAIERRVA